MLMLPDTDKGRGLGADKLLSSRGVKRAGMVRCNSDATFRKSGHSLAVGG